MSFLAGRLAGKEAAYFFEESKHVVARMVQKTPKTKTQINPNSNSNSDSDSLSQAEAADILPEVLRHSLPPKIFRSDPLSDSSLSTSAKWDIRNTSNAPLSSSVSSDVLNPLRAHLSLPQLTFGPKRSSFFFYLYLCFLYFRLSIEFCFIFWVYLILGF